MKTQLIDFEGNFGSQDAALQPTEADFTAFSTYFNSQRSHNKAILKEMCQVNEVKQPTLLQEAIQAA